LSTIKYFTLFLIFACLQFNCTKRATIPCRDVQYNFSTTATIINGKENYKVGDTIRIQSQFPTQVNDLRSGKVIDYRNAIDVSATLGCVLLDSINRKFVFAIDSFSYKAVAGQVLNPISPGANSKSIFFEEDASFYKFEILLILLKKGRYVVGVNNGGALGVKGKDCTNMSLYIQTNNAEKNLHILTNTGIPGVTLTQDVIDHSYCFRVL
jgi:hypothetical protein